MHLKLNLETKTHPRINLRTSVPTRLLALSRKRREGSLLFQYGRGERALYPSILEEGRGLFPLPIWKTREGSLSFHIGRGKRSLYSSNMEEARGLFTLPIWKRREGSLPFHIGRGERALYSLSLSLSLCLSHSLSLLFHIRRRTTLLPIWKRRVRE